MKGPRLSFRFLPSVLAALALLGSCANANDVNAAFRQSRVTWAVFDPSQPSGLRELAGFDQSTRVLWVPQERAVRATGVSGVPGGGGAVAVSRLGLLLVDDPAGILGSVRPRAQFPLEAYQTGPLFLWGGKLFVTLTQPPPGMAPPATLAWWVPGQLRLALFPVPSQVRDPSRQAVAVVPPTTSHPRLGISWKFWDQGRWNFAGSELGLNGQEVPVAVAGEALPELPSGYEGVRAKVAEKLGTDVRVQAAVGPGPPLVFTEGGWVSAQARSDGRPRLFRLPDLGVGGRYTGAVAVTKGWVFTWEMGYRGYTGASGVLHVPTPLLAP